MQSLGVIVEDLKRLESENVFDGLLLIAYVRFTYEFLPFIFLFTFRLSG